jgi:hypothetical protein
MQWITFVKWGVFKYLQRCVNVTFTLITINKWAGSPFWYWLTLLFSSLSQLPHQVSREKQLLPHLWRSDSQSEAISQHQVSILLTRCSVKNSSDFLCPCRLLTEYCSVVKYRYVSSDCAGPTRRCRTLCTSWCPASSTQRWGGGGNSTQRTRIEVSVMRVSVYLGIGLCLRIRYVHVHAPVLRM